MKRTTISKSQKFVKGLLFTCSITLFATVTTTSSNAQTNADRTMQKELSRKHKEVSHTHEVKRQESTNMSIRLKENREDALSTMNQKKTYLEERHRQFLDKKEVISLQKDGIEGNKKVFFRAEQ